MTGHEQGFEESVRSAQQALSRHAVLHVALLGVSLALFTLAGAWAARTTTPGTPVWIAITGLAAGFLLVNLAHEWSHYLGARHASAVFSVRPKASMFLFDWDFAANDTRRFLTMSVAGNAGGGLALLLAALLAPAEGIARDAFVAGAAASFALGAFIEWPVIYRTIRSRDPFAELSKLTPGVLLASLVGSVLVGAVTWDLG